MEQTIINLGTDNAFATKLYDKMCELISDAGYKAFLNVSENKDKSVSVKAKSIVVVKIRLTGKNAGIETRTKYAEIFNTYSIEEYNDEWSRIRIMQEEDVFLLINQIVELYVKVLADLGGESFGCCSRYVECSNEKKCIHPDAVTSLACSYRKNLESGKIFYGKNKNI